MDADDPTTPDTLRSVTEAAAARGVRPTTIKDDILTARLAGVRVPYGHTIHLFVPRAEGERYRHDAPGGKGWDKRRDNPLLAKGEGAMKGDAAKDANEQAPR